MIRQVSLIIIGAILGIFLYIFMNFSGQIHVYLLVASAAIGALLSYIIHRVGLVLNGLLSWVKQPGTRMLAGIVSEFVISISLILLITIIYNAIVESGVPDTYNVLIKVAILLFSIHVIYNVIYYATFSFNFYAVGQLKEAKLRRKKTQLQLSALKSQLSPHFLFNSINTLSSLFAKDQTKAESFIRSLANSYRYTLSNIEEPLVTIKTEMKFVEDYCNMMRTRFGNYLFIENQLPQDVQQTKTPPLTIQMLVENAVKHNIMDENNFLIIKLSLKKGRISISNNKTEAIHRNESLKIGLKNIASRYELLTHDKIEISSDSHFTVSLPIIYE